jgi:hypothetical protein
MTQQCKHDGIDTCVLCTGENSESKLVLENIDKEKYIEDLKEEIYRVKDVINKKGYNNLTAFNQIVREYRTSLKKHLSILISDLND